MENIKNLDKLSRIIITHEEVFNLWDWGKQCGRPEWENFNHVLNEGIMIIDATNQFSDWMDNQLKDNMQFKNILNSMTEKQKQAMKTDASTWIHFKALDITTVEFAVVGTRGNVYLSFTWNLERNEISNKYQAKLDNFLQMNNFGSADAMIDYIVKTYLSLMLFINNRKTEIKTDKIAVTKKKKQKGKNGKKKYTNNVVKLSRKKYIVNNIKNNSPIDTEADREYTRYLDRWTRAGHWRKYKDKLGQIIKKVWIKPTVCHSTDTDKKDIEKGKTYKL